MSSVPNAAVTTISAAGAVTPTRFNVIGGSGALALTLAVPTIDGQTITFTDQSAHAHTIVVTAVGSPPTAGLNGGTQTTLTFNGTKGSSVDLFSSGGSWLTTSFSGVAIS